MACFLRKFFIFLNKILQVEIPKSKSLTIKGFHRQAPLRIIYEHCMNKGFWQNCQNPYIIKVSVYTAESKITPLPPFL